MNLSAIKSSRVLIYAISLLSLIFILVVASHVRGSKRWIDFFSFRLQFSELMKPFLIVAFASVLTPWAGNVTLKRLGISLLFFIPIAFLIFKQPDLGNVIIYTTTFLFLLISAGLSLSYVVYGGIAFIVLSPVIWFSLHDYQRNRILTFLDPTYDPLGMGYNVIQSTIAVGSGMWTGRGLGRGVQSQLQFLPEHHTDFIFATYSEEFGFIGSIVLLLLYFFLLYRILRIAQNTTDPFSRLVAFGAFGLILTQMVINIGMNVGMLPVTGVTLPMFSYGGSSLISTVMLLGFVNGVARNRRFHRPTFQIH